jgi:hypothetical protein
MERRHGRLTHDGIARSRGLDERTEALGKGDRR